MSNLLIVAGFHRSGTSLVANLLYTAGLFLGERLLGANASTPTGHFEDREVIGIHESILRDHGLTWQVSNPFVPTITDRHWNVMEGLIEKRTLHHALWGFKDPRVCLFLMCWKYLVPGARVLVIYRHYNDCAYSLARRHARDLLNQKGPVQQHIRFWSEPNHAFKMWMEHNRRLVHFADAYPDDVLVVSHQALVEGFPLIKVLNAKWGLGLQPVSIYEIFRRSLPSRPPPSAVCKTRTLRSKLEEIWNRLETQATATSKEHERFLHAHPRFPREIT
ncbi:MAG: hypothetical protein O7G83_05830 [Proteobacteria bacterium]|nr:hypothetical protein [Pseudomonadota bacterium]